MIDYKKKYLKYKKKYLMAKKMYGGETRAKKELRNDKEALERKLNFLKGEEATGKEVSTEVMAELEKQIADLNEKLAQETPVVESETDKSEGWAPWLWDKGTSIAVTAATSGLNKVYNLGKNIYDKSQYSNEIMDLLNKEVGDDQEKKNEIIKSIDNIYEEIKSVYDNYAQNVMKEQLNIDIKQYLKKYKNQKKNQKKTPHWYEEIIIEKLKSANNEMKAILDKFKEKRSMVQYAEELELDWKGAGEERVEELIADHIRQKLLQFMETTSGFDLGIAGINNPTTIDNIMSTFSGPGAVEGLGAIANAISVDNLFEEVVGLAASAAGLAGGQKTIKEN